MHGACPGLAGNAALILLHFPVHQHGDAECPVLYSILSILSLRQLCGGSSEPFPEMKYEIEASDGATPPDNDEAGDTEPQSCATAL